MINRMSKNMNLSVNGQSKVPPGFRFHPTEEELLHYYLRKKVACVKIDLDVIQEVDLNKLEPWDIQEICKIGATPQNDWYFFSHKDKKYPSGTRTNRATAAGFWKATGRDKAIRGNGRRIGMRKTLVFYQGRAPHGQKSDWIMHEYRLDEYHDSSSITPTRVPTIHGDSSLLPSSGQEGGWVVCRVFKKKNFQKTTTSSSPLNSSAAVVSGNSDAILDQILTYMGQSSSSAAFKQETVSNGQDFPTINPTADDHTTHLPCLESSPTNNILQSPTAQPEGPNTNLGPPSSSDWTAIDRLVASQLDGQTSKQFSSFMTNDEFSPFSLDFEDGQFLNVSNCEMTLDPESDFWSFTRSSSSSSSDPMGRLSV